MMMIFWLTVISLISLSHSHTYQKCMNFGSAMKSLDTGEMDGVWWEYQSYKPSAQIFGDAKEDDCLTIEIRVKFIESPGITEDVVKRVPGTETEEHSRTLWIIHRPEGYVKNGYFYSGGKTGTEWVYYNVIATDYKSYIIFASCIPEKKTGSVHIFTRSQNPTAEEKAEIDKKVEAVFSKHPVPNKKRHLYKTKDNTKCKPVEFPEIFNPPRPW